MAGAADGALTLGVDLGGTKVLVALVNAAGEIVASYRHPTRAESGFGQIVQAIVESVNACLAKAGVEQAAALGVGVAGQVERHTGVVRFAPNLGWREVPLRAELEHRLSLPVAVLNDVRAATWGEWRHGAGRGVQDLVVLFVGTGVGGGVVSGGRVLEGCGNSAGELGHMTIVVDGRRCRCRNLGCLEAYAGGWAMADRAREAAEADGAAGRALVARAGGMEKITAATVTEAWREGDGLAARLVEETAGYLAAGIVAIVNAFNPCTLVLGGGVLEKVPEYVTRVEPLVRERALGAAVEPLRIVPAALGGSAGVIGAAAVARARPKT